MRIKRSLSVIFGYASHQLILQDEFRRYGSRPEEPSSLCRAPHDVEIKKKMLGPPRVSLARPASPSLCRPPMTPEIWLTLGSWQLGQGHCWDDTCNACQAFISEPNHGEPKKKTQARMQTYRGSGRGGQRRESTRGWYSKSNCDTVAEKTDPLQHPQGYNVPCPSTLLLVPITN